jgi:hypothetical protein
MHKAVLSISGNVYKQQEMKIDKLKFKPSSRDSADRGCSIIRVMTTADRRRPPSLNRITDSTHAPPVGNGIGEPHWLGGF